MDFDDIKDNIPFSSPVEPVKLTLDSEFQFDCHPGVSCFTACCRNINIQLTPYDIVRLKQRLELSSSDFVARYTVPFEMDHHGLPGLNLLTKSGTRECVFLADEGCSVYPNRPAACRYYAFGSMAVRPKDSAVVEDVFFLVKEPHCHGHEEQKKQTVREYRSAQGVDRYDDANREWRDVIIKKRSGGPTIGAPSERSMQLFDMCSYDMDSFREFVQTPGFCDLFEIGDAEMRSLLEDDEALLRFAMRFLKQTLFGERSIALREGARERRIEERREAWRKRRDAEVARHKAEKENLLREEQQQFRADAGDDDPG
ncbi:MAG: YkgJ family cysteine cluster protein [Gammaproteobacteria bacterium]|nr:YkgJ family cysteine cluster protein [Gammaproteobacteria bacterium]